MTNIYETTIIVKPDLANDQLKNLNISIDEFFSENNVSIGYKEDWGIKNLKSSINKYSKGSFKFMRFNASSDFPKKLDGFLKFNTDLTTHFYATLKHCSHVLSNHSFGFFIF